MEQYDFDEIIERRGTDSLRWVRPKQETGRTDMLPLWVADMDFATPPFVIDAIQKRMSQRILGYTATPQSWYEHILWWTSRRYGWNINKEWLHFVAGVVPGINYAINAFSERGEGVLIMSPVYHPFHEVIEATGRKLVTTSLLLKNGRYEMDFDDIGKKLPSVRILILCNPHNPGGTVWREEELKELSRLCAKAGVLIISDEIHADMTLWGKSHRPFATMSEEAAMQSITLMAASKTFNMPGISTSYMIIKNPDIRRRMFRYLDLGDIGSGNIFACDCTAACYTPKGEEWLAQVQQYVEANIKYVLGFLAEHCPLIQSMDTEASFLMFLDNGKLGLSQKELVSFYQDDARLYLNDGTMFGVEAEGFMRLNIGSPRKTIEEAMRRLGEAYGRRGFA